MSRFAIRRPLANYMGSARARFFYWGRGLDARDLFVWGLGGWLFCMCSVKAGGLPAKNSMDKKKSIAEGRQADAANAATVVDTMGGDMCECDGVVAAGVRAEEGLPDVVGDQPSVDDGLGGRTPFR